MRAGGVLATPRAGVFYSVRLSVDGWPIVPLHLKEVRSTFFERLPGAEPDSAFLMAHLKTTWCPQSALVVPG